MSFFADYCHHTATALLLHKKLFRLSLKYLCLQSSRCPLVMSMHHDAHFPAQVRQRLEAEHQVDIAKHKALTRALVDEYVVRRVPELHPSTVL
jgi:hypothetical protein